jgi:NAD(P)-dependent dehydrogenase (short-subunit alcohol dehydrogenase family)
MQHPTPEAVMQGTIVLITGASSGIGRATAQQLAARGYTVFGTSRDPTAAATAAAALPGVTMLPLDVREDESVHACVASVLAQAGRIDVLFNNAGFELAGALEEVSDAEARAQFETNFFGVHRMIRAVVPGLREQRRGRIINMSSLAGLSPVPFLGIYSASKFALEGYSETLRVELRPFDVHVSLIEAGFLNTAMAAHRQHAVGSIADYAPWRAAAFTAIDQGEARGPAADLIAATVQRIIESRRPRLRYLVGSQAVSITRLRRVLPGRMFEYGLRATFGLNATPVDPPA